MAHRFANSLILALREKGSKNLTIVCNSLGDPGAIRGQILAENKQIKKLIAAFSVRPGTPTSSEEQITAGQMEVELVPQGILVERCRAGGAGIPAFYSPTSVGTDLVKGREIREFNGKPYVLEPAINVDYALLRGYRADRLGNTQFRGGSQNFNPSFAKAAKCAIVEVDEIVEPGVIPPDLIDLPGIFVKRVVKTTQVSDGKAWRRPERRPSDKPRLYGDKPAVTRQAIAKNAAKLVKEGTYVNLGVGIPTMVSNYLQGRDVILHAENGVLGYGRMVSEEHEIDPDIYNAAGQFVALTPGASFFDSVTSFEMARGGWIHTVILGAYEVDQTAQRRQLEHGGREARRHRRRHGSALRQGRSHHRDGAHRQQGPAEAAQEVHLSAHGTGLRELRGDRSLGAALGRQALRDRRGGAGLHAAGNHQADRDGGRRGAERAHDGEGVRRQA